MNLNLLFETCEQCGCFTDTRYWHAEKWLCRDCASCNNCGKRADELFFAKHNGFIVQLCESCCHLIKPETKLVQELF